MEGREKRSLVHGTRGPSGIEERRCKKRNKQGLADKLRLFSYLYLRTALPAYNANNTQLNFSSMESDCDKAMEQSRCSLCKICFD